MTQHKEMPIRSVRMPDILWKQISKAAPRCGVSNGRFMRIAIADMIDRLGVGEVRGRPQGKDFVPLPEHDLRESEIQ